MLPIFFAKKVEEKTGMRAGEASGGLGEGEKKELSSVFRSRRMITFSSFSYGTVGLFDKRLKKALATAALGATFLF